MIRDISHSNDVMCRDKEVPSLTNIIMNKILLSLLLIIPSVSADELYLLGGVQHFSSPSTGVPLDSRRETSYDSIYVGLEYAVPLRDILQQPSDDSIHVRGEVMHIIDPEHEVFGDNPFTRFSIEYRHRLFQ